MTARESTDAAADELREPNQPLSYNKRILRLYILGVRWGDVLGGLVRSSCESYGSAGKGFEG